MRLPVDTGITHFVSARPADQTVTRPCHGPYRRAEPGPDVHRLRPCDTGHGGGDVEPPEATVGRSAHGRSGRRQGASDHMTWRHDDRCGGSGRPSEGSKPEGDRNEEADQPCQPAR